MATKLVIFSNRKNSRLLLEQVKLVLNDLIFIEKFWAESDDDKLPSFIGLWHNIMNS